MIVVLDDDPATLGQLRAALDAWARQLRRNGRYPAPDLLMLMRSLEARSGQERPNIARPPAGPHSGTQPADGAGAGPEVIGLTYQQAGLRLGISERTVRRRVASGQLPTVPLGPRLRRIPLAAIENLIRQEPAA